MRSKASDGGVGTSRAGAGRKGTTVQLPTGTLTFLMTDIEGSTKEWSVAPRSASEALALHDRLIIDQVERNRGQIVESGREGDSILAEFAQATDAVECALSAQPALRSQSWPAAFLNSF